MVWIGEVGCLALTAYTRFELPRMTCSAKLDSSCEVQQMLVRVAVDLPQSAPEITVYSGKLHHFAWSSLQFQI